jgi:hypothetical protein
MTDIHHLGRRIFFIAGVYGVLVLTPMFFLEDRIGRDLPPPITHPEYFYGFLCLALVSQALYFLIARDLIRFRPIILVGIAGKVSFAVSAFILVAIHRTPTQFLFGPVMDLFIAAVFFWVYLRTGEQR